MFEEIEGMRKSYTSKLSIKNAWSFQAQYIKFKEEKSMVKLGKNNRRITSIFLVVMILFAFMILPQTSQAASLTFLGADTSTQGSWSGVYGTDGYSIINSAESLPSYATLSYTDGVTHTWEDNSSSTKAVQKPGGGRIASCLYSYPGQIEYVNVNITGGTAKNVCLYLLDWDNSRAMSVSVLDASNDSVLDTQTVSDSSNGVWLKYSLSGSVKFKITATSGMNSVYSAIMFGGVSEATPTPTATPSGSASASFEGNDTTTIGTWIGTYGADGYSIINSVESLPSYATLSYTGGTNFTWEDNTTDIKALQKPAGSRISSCYYTNNDMYMNVNITGGVAKIVELYFYDCGNWSRAETVSILDASTNAVLDTRSVSSFTNGIWLKYSINGNVKIKITLTGGGNAVVSGIMFGGAGSGSTPTPTPTPTATPPGSTPTATPPGSTPTPTPTPGGPTPTPGPTPNPASWTFSDIGSPAIAGSYTYDNGAYVINGSGYFILSPSDQFSYLNQTVSGDYSITTRVSNQTSTGTYAEAGVMFRDSLNTNSALVAVARIPDSRWVINVRSATGGECKWLILTDYNPSWSYVKLSRSGNNFDVFVSADGINWGAPYFKVSANLASTAKAGLFLTSNNSGSLGSATFDNVRMDAGAFIGDTYQKYQISIASPTYHSNVSGTITVQYYAPGMLNLCAGVWHQPDAAHTNPLGYNDLVVNNVAPGSGGYGQFTLNLNDYPHGPMTIKLNAWDSLPNQPFSHSDNCYLQLFNTGGVIWSEGAPAAPAAAAGMTQVFYDDFTSMPTVSYDGSGATYSATKADGGEYGDGINVGTANNNGEYYQTDTYLRLRTQLNLTLADPEGWNRGYSTGSLTSEKWDGSGFHTTTPTSYFECRMLCPDAIGSWPAFWMMTSNDYKNNNPTTCDEIDVIEGYGTNANLPHASIHQWGYGNVHEGVTADMSAIGAGGDIAQGFHIYAAKFTPTEIIYYYDNTEVYRHATPTVSQTTGQYFMINNQIGGGWPVNLTRYNGAIDLWVDYVRVFQQ
jgi:beta-glucanase (GH16 family)